MKRFILSFALVSSQILALQAQEQQKAQIIIPTPNPTPTYSLLNVNSDPMESREVVIKGTGMPLYCKATGHMPTATITATPYSYGIYSQAANHAGKAYGVYAETSGTSNGRSYGVYGKAGTAGNGYNYGVFGYLDGSRNGAGVYGTVSSSSPLMLNATSSTVDGEMCLDGRYAGYFYGPTKVNGTFTATTTQSNAYLVPAAEYDIPSTTAALEEAYQTSALENLSLLSHVSCETLIAGNAVKQLGTSTTKFPRIHHAIPVRQLSEIYPEMVYENEDGTQSVNYMELIPVLIQAINELQSEVNQLKNGDMSTTKHKAKQSETSGVEAHEVASPNVSKATYDLQGQQTNSTHGLLIKDGIKVLNK